MTQSHILCFQVGLLFACTVVLHVPSFIARALVEAIISSCGATDLHPFFFSLRLMLFIASQIPFIEYSYGVMDTNKNSLS